MKGKKLILFIFIILELKTFKKLYCCLCWKFVVISFQVQYDIIIANFLVIFLYYKINYENNDIIIDLQHNINGYLIQSISFRQSWFWDEEKYILVMWDGTIEGCDCERTLFKEKWSKEQIENIYKSMCSNNPVNYTLFNSNYICAKKISFKLSTIIENKSSDPKMIWLTFELYILWYFGFFRKIIKY